MDSVILDRYFLFQHFDSAFVIVIFFFSKQHFAAQTHQLYISQYIYCNSQQKQQSQHLNLFLIIQIPCRVFQNSLQFKLFMTDAQQSRDNKIRSFQSKIINRSLTDHLLYDKLADYLLNCCNAEAKPNTLSFLSFVPLFILSFTIQTPSRANFIFTVLAFLFHQLLDIANKKQAYRLSKFSLSTYYIDHLFDSLSCVYIVLIVSRLCEFTNSQILASVFFFGMLPFYMRHLSMYNNEYLNFELISPPSEGILLLKLIFVVCTFYPQLLQLSFRQIYVYQILVALAIIWLICHLAFDVANIVRGKRVTDLKLGVEEEFPIKNVFAIVMLGYIVMEITSIETTLVSDNTYFYFIFIILSLVFSQTINNLVLAYGYNEKYKQINPHFLIILGIIVIYYAICAIVLQNEQIELLIGQILLGVILALLLISYIRFSWVKIHEINKIIAQ